MGEIVFGRDHHAGGVLVEPMDNAGPSYAAHAGKAFTAMGQQGVYQCALIVPGGRVHDEACRLVDDDNVRIFIENCKRDILALRVSIARFWNCDYIDIARFDLVRGVLYRR